MAEKARKPVDSDYSGRPLPHIPVTDEGRRGPFRGDAVIIQLDGRPVYAGFDGTFELDENRQPDRDRPVDHHWPTLDETLAELDQYPHAP